MSLHHQEYSHFRLTTLNDIKYLSIRLRKADKEEILEDISETEEAKKEE